MKLSLNLNSSASVTVYQAGLAALALAAAPALQAVPNTWQGTTDAFWSLADGNANWSNSHDTQFLDGDDVNFDDTGSAQNSVTLAPNAVLAPTS